MTDIYKIAKPTTPKYIYISMKNSLDRSYKDIIIFWWIIKNETITSPSNGIKLKIIESIQTHVEHKLN